MFRAAESWQRTDFGRPDSGGLEERLGVQIGTVCAELARPIEMDLL
jgi:hypothetical protein